MESFKKMEKIPAKFSCSTFLACSKPLHSTQCPIRFLPTPLFPCFSSSLASPSLLSPPPPPRFSPLNNPRIALNMHTTHKYRVNSRQVTFISNIHDFLNLVKNIRLCMGIIFQSFCSLSIVKLAQPVENTKLRTKILRSVLLSNLSIPVFSLA